MSASPFQLGVDSIRNNSDELVEKIMHRSVLTDGMRSYSPYQLDKCRRDTRYNLQFLSEALLLASDSLWEDYVRWLKFLLLSLGLNKHSLAEHFRTISDVLASELEGESRAKVQDLCSRAYDLMEDEEYFQVPALDPQNPYYQYAVEYKNYLLTAQKQKAMQLINDLAQQGTSIRNIHLDILQPVQREIGNLWQANLVTVAQEHYCTGLTQLAIAQLYPLLFSANPKHHKMIATCVSGELHEIGLRMVTDIMELDGWDTSFLGANMPHDSIVDMLAEQDADLLAISVTFPLNLHKAESLISRIRSDTKLNKVKIIVGGYPFLNDPKLWQQIGADSFASDANLASRIALSMVEAR